MNGPIDPARWRKIRLLAMDVDGVLTDGTLYISSDGAEAKRFSVLDGMGLARVLRDGITVAWISGRSSDATLHRAEELGIQHLVQGSDDKLSVLRDLAKTLGLHMEQIAYMGDDLVDCEALRASGIGIAVPDGVPEVLASADYVTVRKGGMGAVREICDFLLEARALS